MIYHNFNLFKINEIPFITAHTFVHNSPSLSKYKQSPYFSPLSSLLLFFNSPSLPLLLRFVH